MSSNILIFGANGSIGKRLLKKIDDGFRKIICFDKNFSKSETINNKNFIKCDLSDIKDIKNQINDFTINESSVGIYLSGYLSNEIKHQDLIVSNDSHIKALINVLSIFSNKFSHFIYISSISVYGNNANSPISEIDPINPSTIYGNFKASGENLTKIISKQLNLPITILRPTQMYGLESANKTLPHKLLNIQKKSFNRERIFFSKSLRDYIHVNDFVTLLLQIINNPKTGIFNVGSGSPISITDMIMIILNRFGMSMKNKKKSLANNQYLNIKKLNDTYNYEFKINISNWLNDIEYDDQFLF